MSEHDDVEARLRGALRARAEAIEPAGGLGAIEHGVRRHRNRQRVLTAVAASVLVAGAAVGALALTRDDDSQSSRIVADSTTPEATTTTPETTAPATSTTILAFEARGWPGDDVPGYDTPEEAAMAFATEVLGYADPSVLGYDPDSRLVEVQPRSTSSVRTLIATEPGPDGFEVLGARSDASGDIAAIESTAHSVHIQGKASAFEAHVVIQLLAVDGTVLAESFTMAGSGPELVPFEATIASDPALPPAAFVLIGDADASGEGRFSWAAVAPLWRSGD